jgi:ketosteroid isomerase-like protein
MLLPMRERPVSSYRRTRAINQQETDVMNQVASTVLDDALAQDLSERLADVFRTADASDVLADDVFLDGNPPLWRFQLQGRHSFDTWIKSFMPDGADTTVVRTIPTVNGFVTEFAGRHHENGEELTDRKILLAEVRDGRIAELTVYCSGDWNAELRARHAAETRLIRP